VGTDAGAISARTVLVFLLATWPRRVILGLLLLVPCMAALLGGFGRAPVDRHEVAPGELIELGPMSVRPTEFFVSDEVERSTLEYTDGADGWLGVLVEVDNVTTTAITLSSPGPASDAVAPVLPADLNAGITWGTADTVLRVADASPGQHALPDVPTVVALMWPVTDMHAIGDSLDITMTEAVFQYGIASGQDVWLSTGDVWQTTLPRTDLPESLFEPKDEL